MRRVFLLLLTVIVTLGLFAGIGYAGYRLGLAQGRAAAPGRDERQVRPFHGFGHDRMPGMPGHGFGFQHGFHRGFGGHRMGFGIMAPLFWLGPLVVLGLATGLAYLLITRSGWRLTRQTVSGGTGSTPEPPPPADPGNSP